MPDGATVNVQGLRDLRRDLKALGKEVNRELTRDLRDALKPVAQLANARAPRGETGRLAQNTKAFVSGAKAGLRNPLPYANVIHWGWPAHGIEPRKFALSAIAIRGEKIVDDLGDAFEEHARRHGFRGR